VHSFKLPTCQSAFNASLFHQCRHFRRLKASGLLFGRHSSSVTKIYGSAIERSNYGLETTTKTSNNDNIKIFESCLDDMSFPIQTRKKIISDITSMGFTTSSELFNFACDFEERPEALSAVLRSDFGFEEYPPLRAHQLRSALLRLVKSWPDQDGGEKINANNERINRRSGNATAGATADKATSTNESTNNIGKSAITTPLSDPPTAETDTTANNSEKTKKRVPFKSFIINKNQQKRNDPLVKTNSYGLQSGYASSFPKLANELDEFKTFMIRPKANSQENPIREQTAIVYLRHAKLFLGWFWTYHRDLDYLQKETVSKMEKKNLSLYQIIPNKNATSTQCIIEYILWLRQSRSISDSYEASVLRGLIKFVKFRFAGESNTDPSYGGVSFEDIPAVRELRRLHRDAGRRQKLSARSSDEEKKWLEWEEYLGVVRALKKDVEEEIEKFNPNDHPPIAVKENNAHSSDKKEKSKVRYSTTQRRIAIKYQNYLVLAFFASVPDRQRTFRELKLQKTFFRNDNLNAWTIKHGPGDYKTGNTYGDRPPLVIAPELTPAINDFFMRWRPCLNPTGSHVFVQSRTGNQLTSDSMYSIVSRSCYKHSGKKTNPHLLRDMVVTHVRKSNASEKELEALALYMGHSIAMQRNSYDRRTMVQKVAPAVELLRNVNADDGSINDL